jgi:hypothetical protein
LNLLLELKGIKIPTGKVNLMMMIVQIIKHKVFELVNRSIMKSQKMLVSTWAIKRKVEGQCRVRMNT